MRPSRSLCEIIEYTLINALREEVGAAVHESCLLGICDKAYFYKHSGHIGFSQHIKICAYLHTSITKSRHSGQLAQNIRAEVKRLRGARECKALNSVCRR